MPEPKFSVSQITTLNRPFEDDVVSYAKAGAQGIGIFEPKLGEGNDVEYLAQLKDAGLEATTCIPSTLSIWPVPFPGPDDPHERTAAMCAGIDRLAPFEPEVILCLTGYPGKGVDADEAYRVTVDGLRKAAQAAAAHGLTLGVEPLHRNLYATWTTVSDIPGTISLMDDIGEDNVQLLYDVYHLWDTDNVIDDTVKHGARISPSVHVCDWRADTRSSFDRVLPGDGVMDLPALLGALEAGGVVGWFDLEIFSDDGTFEDDFEDSLWKQDPVDVIRRGKAGFERAWAERKAPA
ncbi:MAG: sugar phosphate isomerase/epimerase family protein [Gaiellaceae bacterium]